MKITKKNNMLFLIDGDNYLLDGLAGVELLPDAATVMIFHHKTLNLNKVKAVTNKSAAEIIFIESVRDGKNSVDFQIITELGVLIGQGKVDYAYIISRDQGFLSSIETLKRRHTDSFRDIILEKSIESCMRFAAIFRAETKDELRMFLHSEYGDEIGRAVFDKLDMLFAPPPPEPVIQNPPMPNQQRSRRSNQSRRPKTNTNTKTPEVVSPEAPAAPALPQDAEKAPDTKDSTETQNAAAKPRSSSSGRRRGRRPKPKTDQQKPPEPSSDSLPDDSI